MRIIIGIDPGLAATGYGIIREEGSRYRSVDYGLVKTGTREGMGERLIRINREIGRILDTYHPEEAGVESLFFARNSKSAIPVAQARGVILLALAERGIPFAEYTPLEIKQAVVGRGRADKLQIQEMLRIIFRLDAPPEPDHAADGLAIALCHANRAATRDYFSMHRSPDV